MTLDDGINAPEKGKRKVSESHIEAVDRLYWDPRERAMGVLAILETVKRRLKKKNRQEDKPENTDVPSEWDILCFAVEHTAQMSIVLEDDELTTIAKKLASWLYSSHYSYPQKLYGSPDRPKDKQNQAWDAQYANDPEEPTNDD